MKQRQLVDAGYEAAQSGLPCEAPVTSERDRAAWEQGWRAGRKVSNTEHAEALRKCTGAVKVTLREEVREADGTLRTVSETVSEKDKR